MEKKVMLAVTLNEAQRHFSRIVQDAEIAPVLITREDADTLVLLNASELSALQETAHLMSTQANRDALRTGLIEIEQGKTVRVAVDDL
jgi:antitoxin YefM